MEQKGGLRWAEDWEGVGKGASVTVTTKAEKSARLQSDFPGTVNMLASCREEKVKCLYLLLL